MIRDNNRKVVDGCNRKFMCDSIIIAKAITLKEGCKLVLKKDMQNVIFQIDSKELHKMLLVEWNEVDWVVRPLVVDIKQMMKLITDCKVEVVSRNANKVANWVATQTRKGLSCPDPEGRHVATVVCPRVSHSFPEPNQESARYLVP